MPPRVQLVYSLALIAFVTGLLIMFTNFQRKMIYFPENATAGTLSHEAARVGLEAWLDDSGVTIGWKSPGRSQARHRMLVFHGNAGYALHRTYFVEGLQALGNQWEVLLFEYPGYGAREGKPSARAFTSSAARALEMLLETDTRPVFIAGESLGSGVASHLAATFPDQVAGLLLITPFTSLADVAAHHFPWLPSRALVNERYDCVKALSHYTRPVAFLLAERDEVVPASLGRQLYDSYSGPKWLRIEAGATHNTLSLDPGADWWAEVSDFLTSREGPSVSDVTQP